MESSNQRQLNLKPSAQWGLYVHIPFCARKCPYCDFTIAVTARRPELEYIDALERELAARRTRFSGDLRSIYFGGGTPGILEPDSVAELGAMLRRHLPVDHVEEFSVEFNPEHASFERLSAWKAAGATRISLGVQAFSPEALNLLGREHDAEMVESAVETAASVGFKHISIDFIFALPGIDPEVTKRDVLRGLSLKHVDHISMYELTIEERTAFGVQARRGKIRPKRDDEVIEQWRALVSLVESAGFHRYEVSNYAKPGGEAVHNASYWIGRPYLGIGVGASSFLHDSTKNLVERQANARALKAYLADPLAGADVETLSVEDHLGERLALGLRTTNRLNLSELEDRFGVRLTHVRDVLRELCLQGLVHESPAGSRRFGTTHEGMEIADSLALQVLDALDCDLSTCQN